VKAPRNPLNGLRVVEHVDTGTRYIRLPDSLATPVGGGCNCAYCKSHPDEIPAWDTLVVPDGRENSRHTWTVHWPGMMGEIAENPAYRVL
jgi:hypothetical protein